MALTCSRCSRKNPENATYCFFDGALLAAGDAGPVNPGQVAFPQPFVFASGQKCQNFDQLALTCQKNWPEALDLLKRGMLEGFLGGLGRADLAQAARSAANYPDAHRGLDQLLAKLPTQALKSPRLQVEPKDMNLGSMRIGAEKSLQLEVKNSGGRLLYGSVVSDSPWVALGDKPGHSQKLFQTGDGIKIPIQIRGEHLRASDKAMECTLLVDTNGGQQKVVLRVQVPAKPFPSGVLAGVNSPRQLAIKAKQSPKESAVLFEQGAVKQWYKDNGWTYPVRGEVASGVAAVQQFFEALGLVKPPTVKISQNDLRIAGAAGQQFHQSISVYTDEKRFLYAHASGDQPWIQVVTAKLKPTHAKVAVSVNVPAYASGTLQGIVTISANGNQRFKVPVHVSVVGGSPAMDGSGSFSSDSYATPHNVAAPAASAIQRATGAIPAVAQQDAQVVLQEEPQVMLQEEFGGFPALTEDPPNDFSSFTQDQPHNSPIAAAPTSTYQRRKSGATKHLLPALLLMFMLAGVAVKDVVAFLVNPDLLPASGGVDGDDKNGVAGGPQIPIDPNQRLYYRYGPKKEIGLLVSLANKKLTRSTEGNTNTTVIRLNKGVTRMFGETDFGRWVSQEKEPLLPTPGQMPKVTRTKNVWLETTKKIEVTQVVDILPSELPVEIKGENRRLLDTCLVAFQIENKGFQAQTVGLRVLVDTFIGENDRVPFATPSLPGMFDKGHTFAAPKPIPQFIQALELPSLQKPGTVAVMTLKVGGGLEAPDRVVLTHWPGVTQAWDIPVRDFNGDSCAVLYWDDRALNPGEKRYLGFAYGLGAVTADNSGKLGLTVHGDFAVNRTFLVSALYDTAIQQGESLTLKLPDGLELAEGKATQPVPVVGDKGKRVVTWRVRAKKTGRFPIEVRASSGIAQERIITITNSGQPANLRNIFQ